MTTQQFALESLRTEKVCTGCNERKHLSLYPPHNRAKDGRQSKCRTCINAWMKAFYRAEPARHMLRRAKGRAKKEGFEFDLSLEDILPLPETCPVLGVPLRLSVEPQDPCAYSLDRIENDLGYVRGNVAVMSYRANRLKNDGTAAEHEAIAAWMRAREAEHANDNQVPAAKSVVV